MEGFHIYLNKGMQKSAMMRQAKLDFCERSDRTHPYFWTAFITIGGDSPISKDGWPIWSYLLLGLSFLGTLAGWQSSRQA